MLAVMTKQPAFNLSKMEADMMASAIADLSVHYDITPNTKVMSIASLAAVCGMIYLPRVAAIRAARREVAPQAEGIMPATPEEAIVRPTGMYDFGPQ